MSEELPRSVTRLLHFAKGTPETQSLGVRVEMTGREAVEAFWSVSA